MNELKEYNFKTFEDIRHIDEFGNEYWLARELQKALNYSKWEKFINAIERAQIACNNSNNSITNHFLQVGKIVKAGVTSKTITDYKLSRYACYLIVQNGDSRKEVIAKAQTYFAVQTRKQELLETEYDLLSEEEKRFYQRNLTKKGNYSLNQVAKNLELKTLISFIMKDIKDYIMEKQQMI